MQRLDAKRVFDLALGVPALVVSLPIQIVVAGAVAAKLGRPVLFSQQRPGRFGVPFTVRKFRTMIPVDHARGLVEDDARLTPLGLWLRSTSLDELPTLWNIVRGDMSLVGPRPLLMEYLDIYTVDQARRHNMRPGLTGLAQVNGRNSIDWDRRLMLDLVYVDNRTLGLDLKILCRTLVLVFSRAGVNARGHATMPRLMSSTHSNGSR